MKKHMGIEEKKDKEPNIELEPSASRIESLPFEEEWAKLGAFPFWFEDQYIWIREKSYPLSDFHGCYQYKQLISVVSRWQNHKYSHSLSAKDRQPEDLIFFDTETTGLSSGAGNTIFLLGYCQLKHERIIVKQYFLPGPEAEVALYHYFLTDVGSTGNLVTYNGKAFDWPQVKTRHTFVREQVPKLPKFGHFDLLHASRRLWKDSLPSCKLSIVEKEQLDVNRVEDTPSYLVPMLYFDYLQDPNPDYIQGILDHHEWDVLSLMSLYIHLSLLIFGEIKVSNKERYELARWFEAIGEREASTLHYKELIDLEDEIGASSLVAYAKICKQEQRFEEALDLYKKAVAIEVVQFEGAVECAKLLEHQFKDPQQALVYTEIAFDSVRDEISEEDLFKRKKRLERKCHVFPGEAQ